MSNKYLPHATTQVTDTRGAGTPLRMPPLALYVHIPWCVRKCPYCDFNSHAVTDTIPEVDYVRALLADLDYDLPQVANREVSTIFFGGGTPSLFAAESVTAILAGVRARVAVTEDAEITLEANPGTAEAGKFQGFLRAGINRLSIGVQSFDAGKLEVLGRIHNGREASAAVAMAKAAGFQRVNVDVMYGLPAQTPVQALADLHAALALEPGHISWYQLAVEPHTAFHESPPLLPDDDTVFAMQEAGQTLLARYGYHRYEVSAYARDGHQCRHNLNYWRFGDYLGIGAGAHGKLTDAAQGSLTRLWKVKHPQAYLGGAGSRAAYGGIGTIPESARILEFLMNALRLRAGFAVALFEQRTGLPLTCIALTLERCYTDGLLEHTDGHIRCTPHGYLHLNALLRRFL